MKLRADALLVSKGLAEDEARARALIMAGKVFASKDGRERRVETAGEKLDETADLRVAAPEHPYVSRGGVKLAAALDAFAIDPSGLACADVGASTGGFTDCLLQRGAAKVHAIDVGYGQLAWKLRSDPRVVVHERTNVRLLPEGALGEPIALLVADLSFIGLADLLPLLLRHLAPGGRAVLLVKPQFEAEREDVGAGGVVADAEVRRAAVARVRAAAERAGARVEGDMVSPITGAEGNVEHLLVLTRPR